MQIPVMSKCLPQTIDTGIVSSFRNCDQRGKDRAVGDAITFCELIKDCFNDFNHYSVLSKIFDLVQLEKANNEPDVVWAKRRDMLESVESIELQLQQLIDPACTVRSFAAMGPDSPFVALAFDDTDMFDEWQHGSRDERPLPMLQFTMTLIHDPTILAIWRQMEDFFPDGDKVKAIYALNDVLDTTVAIESRYASFGQLRDYADDQRWFFTDIDERGGNSTMLSLEIGFGNTLLMSALVPSDSVFAGILKVAAEQDRSKNEVVDPPDDGQAGAQEYIDQGDGVGGSDRPQSEHGGEGVGSVMDDNREGRRIVSVFLGELDGISSEENVITESAPDALTVEQNPAGFDETGEPLGAGASDDPDEAHGQSPVSDREVD